MECQSESVNLGYHAQVFTDKFIFFFFGKVWELAGVT